MANPFNAQPNTGFNMADAFNVLNNSQNPIQAFMQLAQNNPQMKQVADMLQRGANPQQLFLSMCQQRGINPQQFMAQFTKR